MTWPAEASRSLLGLQRDEQAAVVDRRDGAAGADRHGDGRDRRILADDLAQRLLPAHHLGERHVLRRFRCAGDEARILLREETLGDADEQIAGERQVAKNTQQRRELVPQHDIEPPRIAVEQLVEAALRDLVEAAVLRLLLAAQEARGHHRRQGQRDERRHADAHGGR